MVQLEHRHGVHHLLGLLLAGLRLRGLALLGLAHFGLALLGLTLLGLPLLGLAMFAGQAIANLIRNVWAWAIIFCGHFTEDIYTFTKESIEGESKGTYPEGMLPEWVTQSGDVTTIDLGRGNIVTYDDQGASYVIPDYGTVRLHLEGGKVVIDVP